MNHEEYGQGFIDGFNAALKSDYIKELYQAADKEQYLKRINELETQLNNIKTIICSYYTSQSQIYCNTWSQYQYGLKNCINAYRGY